MSKDAKVNQNVNEQQILGRADIPTLFIDTFNIGIRSDDFVLLGCVQQLPDNTLVEQARVMFTKEHCKRLIKNLSKATGYYPEKPIAEKDEEKTSSDKKTSSKK